MPKQNKVTLVFSGAYCDLNKYIRTERGGYHGASTIKKEETWRATCEVRRQFPNAKIEDAAYPLGVVCRWYTKDERMDPDNVAFAIKFLMDGMQAAGFLRNDGRKEIRCIYHEFFTDAQHPRVEVDFYASGVSLG